MCFSYGAETRHKDQGKTASMALVKKHNAYTSKAHQATQTDDSLGDFDGVYPSAIPSVLSYST